MSPSNGGFDHFPSTRCCDAPADRPHPRGVLTVHLSKSNRRFIAARGEPWGKRQILPIREAVSTAWFNFD